MRVSREPLEGHQLGVMASQDMSTAEVDEADGYNPHPGLSSQGGCVV